MSRLNVSVLGRSISVPRGLLINGEWTSGTGKPIPIINPATEDVIGEVDSASTEDVNKAVAAARNSFEEKWGLKTPGTERARLIHRLADLIERDQDDLMHLESLDTGKPLTAASGDIASVVATLRYYAGLADKIRGSTIEVDDETKHCFTRQEPVGGALSMPPLLDPAHRKAVVAQIVPWNYPLSMWSWKVSPALAAGCTIVFKPAENTPLSTLKASELFAEAGFPTGVYNCLNGYGSDTGAALACHMDIDKIAFTGNTATGRRIATAAAQSNLKRVTLELGGKSPHIVFESADQEEAAKWVCLGLENAGQCCTAGTRLLVQDSIYDSFMRKLAAATMQTKVGSPEVKDAYQGPQVSQVQFNRVTGFIDRAKQGGARVLTGGKRLGSKGFFIEPTIFVDVDPQSELAREEVFGNVLAVFRFKTEEEAVKLANDTTYGLAAGFHSTDPKQIHRVQRQLKAGTVWVNHYSPLPESVPFPPFKQSGWGKELGVEGLDAYLATKAVHQYYGSAVEWPQ